jgi:hypothetical protein
MTKGKVCKCLRCGKVWTTRKEGRPDQCPKCKQPEWDREAWAEKIKIAKVDTTP